MLNVKMRLAESLLATAGEDVRLAGSL